MEIKNITFSYDQKENHLQHVNADIEKGKITTIIGPNGCGKSTLLGVMANHYKPHHGQVMLASMPIQAYKLKEFAKKLAVVHQQNEAPADMTVERLVSYGRLPHRTMFSTDTEQDDQAIEWALTCTNLVEKRQITIDALSGGEKQRVWIAMALAQQTPFLFLDEPTTYLDMYYQYEILDLIQRLNKEYGLTIVMVLHDINQAIRYSDSIIAMKEGEVFVKGDPKTVITKQSIREIYSVDVMVKEDPETGLYVIPIGI